jgi:hypothetical protein
MFLFCDATRNENAKVTYRFMDRVDDCLSVGRDVVGTLLQIANPSERLARRGEVVAFEQNTTMGERMLRRSIVVSSEV